MGTIEPILSLKLFVCILSVTRRLHNERDWCYIVPCNSNMYVFISVSLSPSYIFVCFFNKQNISRCFTFKLLLFSSDTVSTLVTILNPCGLAFNPTGNILYLTTPYQILSMPFSASGIHPYPTTLAGGGPNGGSQGFADGQGSAALFYWPSGMAIHPLGNI